MARRKVLVTGLSGTVGSALRMALEERYELSSFSRSGVEGLDAAHNIRGSITDLDALTGAFAGQNTVVHLAADRSANAGWESALEFNIVGTYNVFEAAKAAGVARVVSGSSQHAVGGFYFDHPYKEICAGEFEKVRRPYQLLDETVRIRPDGYYGVSKGTAEALGSYYFDCHGLSSIHIRIGWTISSDDPRFSGASLALWLSHRDTAQIHTRAIDAPVSIGYEVVFATSDNYWKIFALDRAKRVLGYLPQDAAGQHIDLSVQMPDRDHTDNTDHRP